MLQLILTFLFEDSNRKNKAMLQLKVSKKGNMGKFQIVFLGAISGNT